MLITAADSRATDEQQRTRCANFHPHQFGNQPGAAEKRRLLEQSLTASQKNFLLFEWSLIAHALFWAALNERSFRIEFGPFSLTTDMAR
jgi:hypothetical protein